MTDASHTQFPRMGPLDSKRARRVLQDMLYRHVVAVKKTTTMAGMRKWYDLFAVQRTVEGREILTWISEALTELRYPDGEGRILVQIV